VTAKLLARSLAITIVIAAVGYVTRPRQADRAEVTRAGRRGRSETAGAPMAELRSDGKLHVVLVLAAYDSSDVGTTFHARLIDPTGVATLGTARGALGQRPPAELEFVIGQPLAERYILAITARREAAYKAYGYVREPRSGEPQLAFADGRLVAGETDCVYVQPPSRRYSYTMLHRYWAGRCEQRLVAWLAGDTGAGYRPPPQRDPWDPPPRTRTTPVFQPQ
jgi:hypothetical protein